MVVSLRQLRRTRHHARAHLSRPLSLRRDRPCRAPRSGPATSPPIASPAAPVRETRTTRKDAFRRIEWLSPFPRRRVRPRSPRRTVPTFTRPSACCRVSGRSRRLDGLSRGPHGPRRGVVARSTSATPNLFLVFRAPWFSKGDPRGRLAFHDEGAASARPHSRIGVRSRMPEPVAYGSRRRTRLPRSTSRGCSPRAPRVAGPL